MSIKYPVRVSLTDETLILDRDNVEVATTFFGKEDYDAEYERRALDAAIIVECLNERAALTARIKALDEENALLVAARESYWRMSEKWRKRALKAEGAIAKKDSTHA